MSECYTCELYKAIKKDKAELAKRINAECDFKLRTTIRCCIRTDGYRKGDGWKNHAGTVTYRPRPMRYCPECGRDLRRRKW